MDRINLHVLKLRSLRQHKQWLYLCPSIDGVLGGLGLSFNDTKQVKDGPSIIYGARMQEIGDGLYISESREDETKSAEIRDGRGKRLGSRKM